MNFRQQIAKYVTGNLTTDQLPDIGIAGLKEGLETPSLCILAGLSKNETPSQIDHYFKQAIEELNIKLPDKRQAAIGYAMAIVDEILNSKKDIIVGTREICYKALVSFDFISESQQYCYDSIGFEEAYGLFDTFEELSNADKSRQTEKENKQLMTETKSKLFDELKIWKDKIKNGT